MDHSLVSDSVDSLLLICELAHYTRTCEAEQSSLNHLGVTHYCFGVRQISFSCTSLSGHISVGRGEAWCVVSSCVTSTTHSAKELPGKLCWIIGLDAVGYPVGHHHCAPEYVSDVRGSRVSSLNRTG